MSLRLSLRPENYPFFFFFCNQCQKSEPTALNGNNTNTLDFSGTRAGLRSNLRSVVVEDDGAEVTAVVVANEVFGGVGALQAACSHALVLQQSLVQGEKHLQAERERDRQTDVSVTFPP